MSNGRVLTLLRYGVAHGYVPHGTAASHLASWPAFEDGWGEGGDEVRQGRWTQSRQARHEPLQSE